MSWSTALSTDAKRKSARGFTLIELMVTVGIIGIMSAIATQAFTKNVRRAHKSEVVSDLSNIVLRENAHLAVHGQYASTALNEDRSSLYPLHGSFAGDVDVVGWDATAPLYLGTGGSGNYFLGGAALHGFDALNFMPEGGGSRCGYGVISGVGTTGRALNGTPLPVEPPGFAFAQQIFPQTAAGLYRDDWFYAMAMCDLDHDNEFWNFTVSSHDTNVVDADVNGIRAEY